MRHLGAYNDKLKLGELGSLPEMIAKRWGDPASIVGHGNRQREMPSISLVDAR
jgi:hypothetical protein